MADLFRRNQVTGIDLLLIDTEGHDFEVFSQVDLSQFTPTVIMMEHRYLPHEEKMQTARILRQHQYKLYDYGNDYIAIQRRS